ALQLDGGGEREGPPRARRLLAVARSMEPPEELRERHARAERRLGPVGPLAREPDGERREGGAQEPATEPRRETFGKPIGGKERGDRLARQLLLVQRAAHQERERSVPLLRLAEEHDLLVRRVLLHEPARTEEEGGERAARILDVEPRDHDAAPP